MDAWTTVLVRTRGPGSLQQARGKLDVRASMIPAALIRLDNLDKRIALRSSSASSTPTPRCSSTTRSTCATTRGHGSRPVTIRRLRARPLWSPTFDCTSPRSDDGASAWRDRVLEGVDLVEVVTGPGGVGDWLWSRWRVPRFSRGHPGGPGHDRRWLPPGAVALLIGERTVAAVLLGADRPDRPAHRGPFLTTGSSGGRHSAGGLVVRDDRPYPPTP